MKRQKIAGIYADAAAFGGQELTVCGWVRTVRDMKNFGFIELNDGSSFKSLQVVFERGNLNNYEEIAHQNVGAALIVHGTLVLTPEAKQPFELKADTIEVEGVSTPDYPLQKKRHSVEFLRTIQHLRPRTNLFSATFRVRSVAAAAIHEFFQARGFVYVHTPIITGSDAEGAGQMFRVTTLDINNPPRKEDGSVDFSQDFFGKPTSLAVTGQLEGETFAMAFSKIYTFGPTFRAENSNTKTHAAEFWMIEPEIAFCDLNQLMDIEEDFLKHIVRTVLDKCPDELAFLDKFNGGGLLDKLNALAKSTCARVTHEEAITILRKAMENGTTFQFEPRYGEDTAK
ncbi:MAG: asparagine--tRNA ligase, partial [Oscillospiraceae bacterium]|nr:asparagine--tRNA ligase [Oscillospiraceae bacterium]